MPPYSTPTPNGPGRCPTCHQPVLWTTTTARRLPLAVERTIDPTGNQAVRLDTSGRHWSRQLSGDRPAPEHDETLHQPHYATSPACRPTPKPTPRPNAPRHRRGVRPVRWQR